MQRQLSVAFCGVLVCVALLAQSPASGRRAVAAAMDREVALRGQPVSITAQVAPEAELKDVRVGLDDQLVPVQSYLNKTAQFSVPADFPLGGYQAFLWVGSRSFYAGELTVAASLTESPREIEVQPLVTYVGAGTAWSDLLGPARGRWSIFGSGFAYRTPQDISLLVNRSEYKVNWVASCDLPAGRFDAGKVYGVAKSARELEVCNVPVAQQGALALSIRQGSAEPPGVVVRATKWPRWLVLGMALGVTVLVAGVVYLLVSLKGEHLIRGQSYRIRALLLDKQTNTYSLSILQFLMWTTAAVFGYSYLALSRLFVQRLDRIPDVPDVLPGIVGVGLGAGTVILSQAISHVRPKGSGEEVPSPSDIVTSGGAVAPDRVQMLVWTVIGVSVFIGGVLKMHPASIETLPAVPNTLMALMGLSSIGYLGAKFARKPGPNILELSVMPAHAQAAGRAPVAAAPVDVTQAAAAAAQAVRSMRATAAGLLESAAPAAVSQAQAAVAALEAGIAAAQVSGVARLPELVERAYQAARGAAEEFEKQAASPGSEAARVSASLAQCAAAALESLAAATGEAVSAAAADTAGRADRHAREFRRVIELRGQNLSPEGIFRARVGGKEYDLPFRMLELRDNLRAPEVVVRDETNPAFARTLRLTIQPSRLEPVDRATYDRIFGQATEEITFTLLNPDGQKAVKTFSVPPGEAQRE